MLEFTKNALVGGAVSTADNVVSSLLNQAFAGLNAKRSWKYTKKEMDYENAINQANWQRENARQDWLLLNQQRLQKQALENAGYSTADPNGTGVNTAAINDLNSPSGGQFRADAPQGSYLPTYQDLLNTKLVESQVNLNNASAGKQQSDSEKAKAETKQIQELLPVRIDEIKANIAKMVSEKEVNEQQAKQIEEDTSRLAQVVKQLTFENKYNDKYFEYRWKNEKQSFENLVKDGRIKEASAKLADLGIVLGADGLTTLIGVAASGKAGQVMEQVSTAIGTLLAGLPAAFMQIWETIKNADKYKDDKRFDPDNKNAKKYPKSEREDVWVSKPE